MCYTDLKKANSYPKSYLVKELLQNKGLPLHIESDYSQQDSEALRTRIEDLIEMLA
ncbi:2-hydroxyacyl-CoA dehydratase [Syntrophomonas zehnderi]|uniref:2-hydroxyacyl-CoA dehydratase n=1 Tax=Syntrophomonas zehnderi TaxID=404335 RepID=UPI000A4C3F21|nr:2-hydroxyacyl-CoA dehydratase family protein [Syntrophomonas zehnderi]